MQSFVGLTSPVLESLCSLSFIFIIEYIFVDLLPIISSLSADLFLRALQSLEKISSVWLLGPDTSIPDANTLFKVYGEYIFDAVSIDKPSHEAGRAIAISILCKILSKRQYRTEISDQYLTFSFSCMKKVLLFLFLFSWFCLLVFIVSFRSRNSHSRVHDTLHR